VNNITELSNRNNVNKSADHNGYTHLVLECVNLKNINEYNYTTKKRLKYSEKMRAEKEMVTKLMNIFSKT
jgi:hypothetical protein